MTKHWFHIGKSIPSPRKIKKVFLTNGCNSKKILSFFWSQKYNSPFLKFRSKVRVFWLLTALFLSLWRAQGEAGIESYFKKAENKSDLHRMRGIDFIYVLNLDERPEKFEKCAQQLALWNIVPYRFSAVNGWKLKLDTINDVGVTFQPWMMTGTMGTYYETEMAQHEFVYKTGRTYFCHCMSRGAVGIALSHLSILQDALDSGYETIWVMEDDIDVLQDPHLLSDLVESLDEAVGKEEWDILFTDQDTKNSYGQYVPCTGFAWRPNYAPKDPGRFERRMNVSPEFRKVGARFGAYSMIVRRSGMKKILEFLKQYGIFLPYDIEYPYPEDIRLYTVLSDIVSTWPGSPSDNGAPAYENRKR
jgi:GR25 family glycosyltransferase involved in LPS biosynthesis